jgi:hypothetical protein
VADPAMELSVPREEEGVVVEPPLDGAFIAQLSQYAKVSLQRLLDESPWLQFTSECQRHYPHRASVTSRFGQVHRRVATFEQLPDAEQLYYAFSEAELRLLMRFNRVLTTKYVRDPATGAHRCVEMGREELIVALLPALHRLRPAGALRAEAMAGRLRVRERWPQLRPPLANGPFALARGTGERPSTPILSALGAEAAAAAVSLKRLLDKSPWLQFTGECQQF